MYSDVDEWLQRRHRQRHIRCRKLPVAMSGRVLVGQCWQRNGRFWKWTDYRKTDTSLPAMQLPIPEIRRCRNRQLRFLAMCESLPAMARFLNGRTEKRPVAGNDRRFRKWHVPLPAIYHFLNGADHLQCTAHVFGLSVYRCFAAGIRQRTTDCERCSVLRTRPNLSYPPPPGEHCWGGQIR